MLGLALELRRRGHEVTFATSGHYADLAKKHGLPFEALGGEEEFQACVRHPDLWHPQRAFGHIFRTIQPVLRQHYEMHAQLAARGDGAAVTNCFGFGAFDARDKFGLPVLTLQLQPAGIWSDVEPPTLPGLVGPRWLKGACFRLGERFVIDRTCCPFLNDLRRERGLPPIRRIVRWWNSPDGVLCMFPEWYVQAQPDWPTPLIQTDFPLWNDGSDEPLAGEVETFLAAGSPPLVFTPGSANAHGRSFFQAAVEACVALDRRGILLTKFPEQLPASLPLSIAAYPYVPLDQLLPRAAAFVHHGGVGSTSQAMLAGVPQVLTPLAHDQFDNAARVRRLGVGDAIPSKKLTGKTLADVLLSLLESSTVAASCREIASRMRAPDGLSRTADAVERLVSPTAQEAVRRRE